MWFHLQCYCNFPPCSSIFASDVIVSSKTVQSYDSRKLLFGNDLYVER